MIIPITLLGRRRVDTTNTNNWVFCTDSADNLLLMGNDGDQTKLQNIRIQMTITFWLQELSMTCQTSLMGITVMDILALQAIHRMFWMP